MPHAEFERFVADVASTGDAVRRMDKAEDARERAGLYFYQKMHEKLSKATGLVRDDLLPPDPDTLLQHFRFSKDNWNGPVSEQLSIAAERLLRTESLDGVLNRLSMLPIPLPAPVVNRVLMLSARDRRKLLRRLLRKVSSPVFTLPYCVHRELLDSA